MRTLLFLTLTCVSALSPSLFHAQAGQWVLDGWPNERNGYFAGRTEIHADGGRLKITEWPEDSDDPTTTLETYFVGRTVVKVFPWNGERIGLVFESADPLPTMASDAEGRLTLPPPFPSQLDEEGQIPCGEGCAYGVRCVSFQPMDAGWYAPGGEGANTFEPRADIPLMTKAEFLDRHRLAPPTWTPFGEVDKP